MDRDADPALQFFPDGNIDLYGALEIDQKASEDQVKKAYRKLALRYHPDKVAITAASSSAQSPEELKQRFQQINFAYTVLSSESRRKRYDDTGRTDESMFEEVNWEEWVKDFGKLDADKLDKFKQDYQNSNEERKDLLQAYVESNGSLEEIFTMVPCSEVLVDEDRFVKIVESAIAAGEVERLPAWAKSIGDKEGRKKMRAKAKKEATEAEEYAKELGVWDDLFGKGSSKKGSGKGATDDQADVRKKKVPAKRKPGEAEEEAEVEGDASSDEEEEADDDEDEEDIGPSVSKRQRNKSSKGTQGRDKNSPPKPVSSKAKSKPKPEASSKRSKKTKTDDEEDGDLSGLAALMAKRSAQRGAGFNDMIARMEANARQEESSRSKGKGKGKSKSSTKPRDYDEDLEEGEPDEAAFLAARAKIDARKAAASSSSSKSKSGKKK